MAIAVNFEARLPIQDNETICESISDKCSDPELKGIYSKNLMEYQSKYPEAHCFVCRCNCKGGFGFEKEKRGRLQVAFLFYNYVEDLKREIDILKLPVHLQSLINA